MIKESFKTGMLKNGSIYWLKYLFSFAAVCIQLITGHSTLMKRDSHSLYSIIEKDLN